MKQNKKVGCLSDILAALLIIGGIAFGIKCCVPFNNEDVIKIKKEVKVRITPSKKDTVVVDTIIQEKIKEVGREPKEIITMEKEDGGDLYYVTVWVNGVPIKAIVDTGCSNMAISTTEFCFLKKQGFIDNSAITGNGKAKIADNSVIETLTLNLKTIKIGEITINDVSCYVINNNNAQPLLGQAVLSKLGEVSIDYQNHRLLIY